MQILDIALYVARIAEANGDRELIAVWYRVLCPYLLGERDFRESPAIAELREIVRRTDAMSIPMSCRILRDPSPEDLAELPDVAWWHAI